MQLTKQQKIYCAVLGAALACFAADRWVIGHGDAPGDDVAVASTARKAAPSARRPAARRPAPAIAARGAVPATPASAASSPASSLQPSVAHLAIRLQEVARTHGAASELDHVRDAFRPSTAFLPARPQAVVVKTSEPARDEVGEFMQAHRLEAVMKRASGGVAIVDKKTVRVGQSFEGFRLVAVKERSAVFRRGALRAELRLPEDVVAGEIIPSATSEKVAGAGVGE